MKRLSLAGLALVAVALSMKAQARAGDIFPYPIYTEELSNGLKVVMVPFDSPGIVAYYSVVRVGSRNEVEPGHSGFAHFFEHMMFRGTDRYPASAYNLLFKQLGSDANAFTTDDYTCYHCIFSKEGLEKVIEVESDRFMNLKYTVAAFKQESRAVLGEYNKSYSNPYRKLYEKLRATAYTTHTYRHTTMGFIEDIEDMPNQYDYSLEFFDRYYRPNNTVIIVVGDIDPRAIMTLIEKYYGSWEPNDYEPNIPLEPEQKEFRSAHIEWKNRTLPYLAIGYHVPAFSTENIESAALDILSDYLFGENSDLHKQLVLGEQSVEYIWPANYDHRDGSLLTIIARVKKDELLDHVKQAIYKAVDKLKKAPIDEERLERIKAWTRYNLAMRLDTPGSVARLIAHYTQLTGDPRSINDIYRRYQEVSARDLVRMAKRYLIKSNCTEITLTGVKSK